MANDELERIFQCVIGGVAVEGWGGASAANIDVVRSFDPDKLWVREAPGGMWKQVPATLQA